MNLMYLQNKQPVSLVVPLEAVRGLRYQNGQWRLYVSDPDPMSVSVFRLTPQTLNAALTSVHTYSTATRISSGDGEKLWQWLLQEANVEVELMEAAGLPSMFPKVAGANPNPNLGMKGPQMNQ